MERRPHPTHDRTALIGVGRIAGLFLLSFGVTALGLHLKVTWLQALGFVSAFVAVLFPYPRSWRINWCLCPSCGQWLRRGPDTTEFVCGRCQVVWWTRCFGYGPWD